jgi:Tol biopolymer transport system component
MISPVSGKMYYTGYEPGIWVMERSGATWGKPQKLVSNGMFSTLTRDETLYTTVFNEKGKANVGRYAKKDGKYETPEVLGPEINSAKGFDAHPNVAPDGSFLLFDRQQPEGNGLYISFRGPDGAWSPAGSLGAEFHGSLSTFSPDGKYLFFMKSRDIYWVSAKIIEELRPKEKK